MALIRSRHERYARALEKRVQVLTFLREETWATAGVMARVMGGLRTDHANTTLVKLEREGLLRSYPVRLADGHSMKIWGITEKGVNAAWTEEEEEAIRDHPNFDPSMLSRPHFQPSKLKVSALPHQTDLQNARLAAEAAGWTNWQRGERLGFMRAKDKIPDALVTRPDGIRVAIEVERTIKSKKRYREILAGHIRAMLDKQWSFVYYVCPSEPINVLRALPQVFEQIPNVRAGHNNNLIPLDNNAHRRFHFEDINAFPSQ